MEESPMRIVMLSLVVLMFASLAEAECLKCYPGGPPPHHGGNCGITNDEYSNRGCDGKVIGDSCPLPDFLDFCDPWGGNQANGKSVFPQDQRLLNGRQQLPEIYLASGMAKTQSTTLYRRLGTLKALAQAVPVVRLGRCTAV
jgi:hypothetical protein